MQTLTWNDLKNIVNSMTHDQLSDPVAVVRDDAMVMSLTSVNLAIADIEGVDSKTGYFGKLMESGQAYLA